MTDYANETSLKKRIPQDKFEVELYRRMILAEMAGWQNVDASLVDYNEQQGTWSFHVTKPQESFDMSTFLDQPFVAGEIWIDEREYPVSEYYRVAVSWRIGSQANTSAQPVLDWELPNPAGPWS